MKRCHKSAGKSKKSRICSRTIRAKSEIVFINDHVAVGDFPSALGVRVLLTLSTEQTLKDGLECHQRAEEIAKRIAPWLIGSSARRQRWQVT
mgnify:CR=1 FL=1